MLNPVNFYYDFYPVGQGLFAEGTLQGPRRPTPQFNWVYDCGTVSARWILDRALTSFRKEITGSGRVDLVALSHFDRDHLSGICQLIQQHRIGTLILPYMPLAERLLILFEERFSLGSRFVPFFLNPVAFLTGLGGPGIERILFIPASGEEGPPDEREQPGFPPDRPEFPKLELDPGRPPDWEDAEFLAAAANSQSLGFATSVEFLREGGRLHLGSLWEFVPYNDDPQMPIPQNFLDLVLKLKAGLLAREKTTKERESTLQLLKEAYDREFGGGSLERNVISLFLYGGPIYPTWRSAFLWREALILTKADRFRYTSTARICHPRCSILYTGDGFLDTSARLHKLTHFLRANRVSRIGVFQVMHHGARRNSHSGVASAFSPVLSVFSSDPNRRIPHHPHREVWRTFRAFGRAR